MKHIIRRDSIYYTGIGFSGIASMITVFLSILIISFSNISDSGKIPCANVSEEVESYRTVVREIAGRYRMEDYVELILAVIMQESGGRTADVMQASESGYNLRYPRIPQGIQETSYSIACGVQALKECLEKAQVKGPTDLEGIKLALQGYNFGPSYIYWAMKRDGCYTKENAKVYSDLMCQKSDWKYKRYGDKEYVDHVLRYYVLSDTANGVVFPEQGMKIPVYYQNDYRSVSLGSSTIAKSGCGFTSCAMVASYISGKNITPEDIAAWGQKYYISGSGMSWSLPAATAAYYQIGSVTQTRDFQQVLMALRQGKPVICSQSPGLFTKGGHIIVLRGVNRDGKVYVNDPNKANAVNKGYQNRAFDLEKEIHRTAKIYWIFEGV